MVVKRPSIRLDVREQFPSFEDDLPVIDGFDDSSWRHDAAPSLTDYEHNLQLFVDHLDPSLSDWRNERVAGIAKRFTLMTVSDGGIAGRLLVRSDDIEEIRMTADAHRSAHCTPRA
jgi:hypothetical protein